MEPNQKLMDIWQEHGQKYFYVIAEDTRGNQTIIEGFRPPDEDGGCMATGTPGSLYGRSVDGQNHWFNHPSEKNGDLSEWKFVKGHNPNIWVKSLADGKASKVVGETVNGWFLLDENGNRNLKSKNHYEIVESRN